MNKVAKLYSFYFLGGEKPLGEVERFLSSLCASYGEDLILSYLRDKKDLIQSKKFGSQMHLFNYFKKVSANDLYQYRKSAVDLIEEDKIRQSTQNIDMPKTYRPTKKKVRELDIFERFLST